jgi:hypothetical protein
MYASMGVLSVAAAPIETPAPAGYGGQRCSPCWRVPRISAIPPQLPLDPLLLPPPRLSGGGTALAGF